MSANTAICHNWRMEVLHEAEFVRQTRFRTAPLRGGNLQGCRLRKRHKKTRVATRIYLHAVARLFYIFAPFTRQPPVQPLSNAAPSWPTRTLAMNCGCWRVIFSTICWSCTPRNACVYQCCCWPSTLWSWCPGSKTACASCARRPLARKRGATEPAQGASATTKPTAQTGTRSGVPLMSAKCRGTAT